MNEEQVKARRGRPPKQEANKYADDIARARAARERRRSAPPVNLKGAVPIVQKERIKQFVPEAVDKRGPDGKVIRASMHAMYGDRTKYDDYVSEGYEPVIDGHGQLVTVEGDPLLKIDRDLYERGLQVNLARAVNRIGQKSDEAKEHPGVIEENAAMTG